MITEIDTANLMKLLN